MRTVLIVDGLGGHQRCRDGGDITTNQRLGSIGQKGTYGGRIMNAVHGYTQSHSIGYWQADIYHQHVSFPALMSCTQVNLS
jgi:hypothetical protein